MNVLELSHVHAGYGALEVLHDVNLAVPQRSVLALVGPNGAGKTTVMRTIAGVLRSTSGVITHRAEDITSRPYHQRLNRGIAWVAEGRMLFGDLTVEDNLQISSTLAGTRKAYAKQEARVFELFPILADRRHQRAGSMSGGQQQMLAIARALVRDPELVLLDEPSIGLAPAVVLSLGSALRYMVELGVAVLVADQSVAWLEGLSGNAAFIQGGTITLTGGIELIHDRELVRQAYLGETDPGHMGEAIAQ